MPRGLNAQRFLVEKAERFPKHLFIDWKSQGSQQTPEICDWLWATPPYRTYCFARKWNRQKKEIIINFIIKWNTLYSILWVLKHIYINIVDRYFYRHMSSYFYALSRGCAFRENRAVRLSISTKHRHSAACCCCTYLHKNLIDIFDIRW